MSQSLTKPTIYLELDHGSGTTCILLDKKKSVYLILQVLISPPHPDKVQISPHPLEGLSRQMPYSPGSENGQMLGVCPGWGRGEGCWRFELIGALL